MNIQLIHASINTLLLTTYVTEAFDWHNLNASIDQLIKCHALKPSIKKLNLWLTENVYLRYEDQEKLFTNIWNVRGFARITKHLVL
jgi:hypothetical protein